MAGKSKYLRHKEPDAEPDYDADDPGKRAKASVNYSKGNMDAHCGICRHFEPPHACGLVAGHIVPSFWCRLFAKAKVRGGMGKHMRSVR